MSLSYSVIFGFCNCFNISCFRKRIGIKNIKKFILLYYKMFLKSFYNEPIAIEIPLAYGVLLAEVICDWSFNTYGCFGFYL
jgi:hypothetical protein